MASKTRSLDDAQRRIRDLEIVNDVAQIISTKLDTKELLQTIVTQIVDKLDCTHCTLFFPQEEEGELLLVPQVTYGLRSKEIKTRRFRLGEGLAGWVFQEGESLVLADARADSRFSPAREKREQPRSMLVVPVRVGDRTIGVISADQDEYGWFSESDRRLVDALARHAGVAIERATGLALLQDIGNRIISAQEVDNILQEIVSGAIKLTHTTSGVIYLVSGDGKSVTDRFLYPPGFDHPAPRMDREESVTRQVIKTGEMLIFPDAHQDVRQGARVNPVLYNRVRSMIAVPLKLEQKVIGVLFLNDADRHDFTEIEVSLLSTLAGQAASAIQNARLLQQERNLALRQTRLTQHSHEVSRLALTGDYEKLADYVAEAVNDLTAASVTLWMLDEKENVLRIQAGRGLRREYMENAITPVEPGRSITSLALRDRSPVSRRDILDETEEPRFYNIEEAIRQGWRSFLSVPLLGQAGQPLGTLSVYYTELRDFSEPETALLWTFANQAAIAFENVQTMQKLNTQLESLHRVVQEESLEEVLEQILKGINTILGEGTSSSINLYDEASDSFGPSTAVGPLADLLRVPPRAKSGTGRHVLETREAYYLDDVTKPPSGCPTIRDALAEQSLIKSFAALPLKRQDRIVGVLFVNLQVSVSFSAGVRRVLELFASQAAVAIENARLFQELDDRAERLVQLQGVTAAISAISAEPSDLTRLLHLIVERLRDIFKGASCAIRLYDSRKDEFGSRVAVGAVEGLIDHTPRSSKGTSRYVIQTRQPLYIEDVSATLPDGAPTLRREVLALGIKAAAYLPLLSERGVIGILYMDLTEPRQFSQYDKQILELFANQAAIAIENAHLLQDLDERARQLEKLQKVTATISAEPSDLEKVLDLIVDSLNEMFGEASCAVRLYDSESNEFKQREAVGELKYLWKPIRLGGTSWTVAKTKIPLYIEDTLATPPGGQPTVRDEFIERGVRAVAYLPLISKENVIGILYLNLTTPHQFSQDEKRVLKLFADQAAIAIENARLYEYISQDLERRIRQLEVLPGIYEKIIAVGIEDIDRILDLLYEEASEVLDLSNAQVQIAFYDEAKGEVSFPLAIEKEESETIDIVRWSKREAQYRKPGEDEIVEQFKPRVRRDPPGLNEYVIRTKEPLLTVEDFEQKAKAKGIQVWPTFGRLDRPTHSWLGVPMMVGGQVTGVISIQSLEQERAFDKEQQELLSTVASQAAVAIENARLYEDLAFYSTQLEELYYAGLQVSSRLEVGEALFSIAQQVCRLLGADTAAIFPYSAARKEFGEGVRVGEVSESPTRPSDRGLASQLVRGRAAVFRSEQDMTDEERVAIDGKPVLSYAGIPLVFEEESVGLLFIDFYENHVFSEGEKRLAQLFGLQAASAINNARQYEVAQKLARIERWAELGQLAGSLAHRIGNTGGTIRLRANELAEYLSERLPNDATVYSAIETIARNNQYLLDLSTVLLKPFRAFKERMALSNIALLINGALNSVEIQKDVKVETFYTSDLPLVKVNRFFVEVFLEIIANAIEAMRDSSKKVLTIRTEYDDNWVKVSFTDTGMGIPGENQSKIFELFASREVDEDSKHFGFGLWWVRTFLRDLGGDIEVESQVNKGTTFTIRLPREEMQ